MAEYYVTGVSRYDFTDKDTGRVVKGCKIQCLDRKVESGNTEFLGRRRIDFSADFSLFTLFTKVPSKYELSLDIKVSGGKPVAYVTDVELLDNPYTPATAVDSENA